MNYFLKIKEIFFLNINKKKTIIFISYGGLGNQLFQISFLLKNFKNQNILIFGFDDLKEYFNLPKNYKLYVLDNFFKKILIRILLKNIFLLFSRLHFISSLYQLRKNEIETINTIKKNGIIKSIVFVKESYFQSEYHIPDNFMDSLSFKKKYSNLKVNTFSNNYIMVHFRGGDFKNFYPLGKNSILPENYFNLAFNFFENIIDNPIYHIYSNDSFPFEEILKDRNFKIIKNDNSKNDFFMMTKYQNAILSASTFSWWASFFMKEKKYILIPKYWLGFNSGVYYPERPIGKWMTEIDFL